MPNLFPPLPVRPLARLAHLLGLVIALLRDLGVERPSIPSRVMAFLRRLGLGVPEASRTVWVHGEGPGEFSAAGPLLAKLTDACPGHSLLLTTSRSATLRWLERRYPGALCLPLPWDVSPGVARFYRRLRPRALVLLEFADGFPLGALLRARRTGVPVVVLNARRLQAPKPWRFRLADRLGLSTAARQLVDRFCVQDAGVMTWLADEGIPAGRRTLTGNLKYDGTRPADPAVVRGLLTRLGTKAPVLVAGCVHAGEERLILETYRALRRQFPDVRLVVAPMEAGQLPLVEQWLCHQGVSFCRHTDRPCAEPVTVVLLDSFGDLASAYAIASVVLLGGSLTARGAGHSLVEPAVHSCPIVVGPHMSSQQTMLDEFLAADAVLQVPVDELLPRLARLLSDEPARAAMGKRARGVVAARTGATDRTFDAVRPLLPTTPPNTPPRPGGLKGLVKAMALSRTGQRLLNARVRRLTDWESVRDRLGRPHSILCLGNGPSSEDPRLRGVGHDCLFRVNWRWRERNILTSPDVVFTGDYRTLRHCPDRLFGFRTVEEETLLTLRSFSVPRLRRLECVTLERLPSVLQKRSWGARPTNGAVMIASAVALQPERLIIAGIDLYRHPAGRYPGDRSGDNRYSPAHTADVELAILGQALGDYRGELTVIGEPLRQALRTAGRAA